MDDAAWEHAVASPIATAYSERMLLAEHAGMELGGAPAPAGGAASHIGPLTAWLAIQLALLLLPVLQVPLADQFTRPAERAALEVMLVGQVLFAALLFPWLLRSAGAAVMMAAASWPFIQLAMVLSSADAGTAVWASAYATAWIAALAGWRYVLRKRRHQLAGVAAAMLLCAGGAALWYLRAEFVRNSGGAQWGTDALLGPVVGVLAVASGHGQNAWLAMAGLVIATAAATFISHLRRK